MLNHPTGYRTTTTPSTRVYIYNHTFQPHHVYKLPHCWSKNIKHLLQPRCLLQPLWQHTSARGIIFSLYLFTHSPNSTTNTRHISIYYHPAITTSSGTHPTMSPLHQHNHNKPQNIRAGTISTEYAPSSRPPPPSAIKQP